MPIPAFLMSSPISAASWVPANRIIHVYETVDQLILWDASRMTSLASKTSLQDVLSKDAPMP